MTGASASTNPSPETFKGEIVVVSRIVDYLSSGLYHSPAACLKELINNSYDADATLVRVFVQPEADQIIIADDGHGMTRKEFEENFGRIAETQKRALSEKTPSGRPKIGKIGIGFIAANEICDVMELESTKKGSTEKITARINFRKMRLSIDQRRRGDADDIAKGDYEGAVSTTDSEEHYTRLFLKQVRSDAREIFVGTEAPSGHGGQDFSLYGLTNSEVAQLLRDPRVESWDDFDPYSRTILEVALNVPVKYHDDWAHPTVQPALAKFSSEIDELNFDVFYDGAELRKPTVLWPAKEKLCFVKEFHFRGRNVRAKGYFYVQHGTVKPRNLGGLLLRIRNAAVGEYDSTFLGFPTSRGPLFQRWISAEIWAEDELEDALNIDRRTLRISHPAYVELQKAVHDFLADLLAEARSRLYRKGSETRRKAKVEEELQAVESMTTSLTKELGSKTVEGITKSWRESLQSSTGEKKLTAKYSISELYSLVIRVANETLAPADARRFLAALTRKLTSED